MFVGVTGHQDIPPASVLYISNAIRAVLEKVGTGLIAVTSLAAGADQLFADVAIQVGGRLYVVLPCRDYESTFDDEQAKQRFRHWLSVAANVDQMSFDEPSETAFFEAGKRVVNLSQLVVAVWDRQDAKGKGGTADIVEYANEQNKTVEIVWPPGAIR